MSIDTGADADDSTPTKGKRPSARGVLITTAALLLLGAGYAAGQANAAPAPAPAPVEIVKTVEVPGPVKDKTPAACITALSLADEGFTIAGDSLQDRLGSDQRCAGRALSRVNDAVTHMNENNVKIGELAPKYQTAKASCQAAA